MPGVGGVRLWPPKLPRGSQPLVALLGGSAVLLFILLTEEMLEGDTRRLDAAVLVALRSAADPSTPLGPKWLPQVAVDLTALGGFAVLWLLTLAAVGFLLLIRRRLDAGLIVVSVGGASLLNAGLKLFVDRGRPDVVPHLVVVSNASYPSGHAMISAAAYLTIAAMLAHIQPRREARIYLLAVAAILVILIGLSRLYLGVHWPSDVAAGWCLGSAWALAVWLVAQRLRGDTARADPA